MEDGILDLVVFILVLAICLGVGFKLIVESAETTYDKSLAGRNDKTMGAVDGIMVKTTSKPGLSKAEVVIATEIQDYRLPLPTKLTIGNSDPYYVTGKHPSLMKNLASETWEKLKDDPDDIRYDFIFDYGNPLINLELTKTTAGEVTVATDEDINETYRLVRLALSETTGIFTISEELNNKLIDLNKKMAAADTELSNYKESLYETGSTTDKAKYNKIKYMNAWEYNKAIENGLAAEGFLRLNYINAGYSIKIDIGLNAEIGTITLGTGVTKVLSPVAGKISKSDIIVDNNSSVSTNDIIAYIHF